MRTRQQWFNSLWGGGGGNGGGGGGGGGSGGGGGTTTTTTTTTLEVQSLPQSSGMDVAAYPVYDIKDIWHIWERLKEYILFRNPEGNVMTDGRVLLKKESMTMVTWLLGQERV